MYVCTCAWVCMEEALALRERERMAERSRLIFFFSYYPKNKTPFLRTTFLFFALRERVQHGGV